MEALSSQKKNINYNTTINYLLVVYALCLPISKAGVNLFETLIILTWILQGNWREKYILYKSNPLIIALLSFILLHIISIPLASSTYFAMDYILKYKHLLIILPIYSSLNKKFIQYIFSAFLIGIFISEIVSYGIFFEVWNYNNTSPLDPSPFMSRVDYSVYLSFASVLLLIRFLNTNYANLKIKIIYFLFFISATVNLFINSGRTGQLTFAIMIFISIFIHLENKLKAFFLSTLLLFTVFTTAYISSSNFKSRLNQTVHAFELMIKDNNYKSDGVVQRISLWIVGFDNFKDNYIYGKGIGNSTKDTLYYAQKRGFDSEFLSNFGDNHNMFLIVSLQFGILGLLLIIYMFYTIYKLKFNSEIYKILNLTFIISFSLWSFGNTTLHTMNPMVFFALFAGIFNTISKIETTGSKP